MITAKIVTEPFEAVIGNDFKINVNTITDIEGNPLNLDTTFIEIEWQDIGGIKYLTRHDPRGESENCKIEDGKLQIIFDKTQYRFRYPDVLTYRVHARSYDGDLRDNSFDIWTPAQTSNISLNSGSRKFGCQTALAHVEMPYAPYKGDKGDRGEQGEIGIQGARGECGEQGATGERGEIGERGPSGLQGEPGIKGEAGLNGKSSYIIALDNGYIGTEQQFGKEQAAIAVNSARLTAVETTKQDKPIAGRTFLTPLFVARGAVFNVKTGFYELNGLLDITEAQMMTIYIESSACFSLPNLGELYARTNMRTNLLSNQAAIGGNIIPNIDCSGLFSKCDYIEIIKFNGSLYPAKAHRMFDSCLKLKSIIHTASSSSIALPYLSPANLMFNKCIELENIKISSLGVSITFSDSPNLSYESIRYIINNAANKTPITLTLHPTAKARLTEEDIALAVSKNITIA